MLNILAALNPFDYVMFGLIGVMVVLIVISFIRQKKQQGQIQETVNQIRIGDKIKTQLGIYGTIIEITETTDGKICVVETGNNKTQITMHMGLISGKDEKTDIVRDANGEIILPEIDEPKEAETKASDVNEEIVSGGKKSKTSKK